MPKDTRRAFVQLEKKLEPAVRKAFRQSVSDMVDSVSLREIEAAIQQGDVQRVMQALNLKPEFLAPLDRAITQVFQEGAEYQLSTISSRQRDVEGTLVRVRFNGRHPRADALIREQSGRLITEIIDDQRTLIRSALERSFTEGSGRRQTVLELAGRVNAAGRRVGGLVGLISRQADYVASMKTELKNTDSNYFTRQLRDKRFDSKVRAAIKSGKPLPATDIDKITGRYSGRLLKARADTIARTETHAALNRGKSEAVDQLIDSGKVTSEMTTKIWDATPSGRTRDTHSYLNGQVRKKEEYFDSSSGARLMYPHDSNAPGAETINCRCSVRYRIDWMQQAV